MNRVSKRTLPFFLLAFLGAIDLEAMIVRKYPMKEVLKQSQYVFEARVQAVDSTRKRLVVEFVRDLKGVAPFSRLNLNLLVSPKKEHQGLLLKRVENGLPLVVFATRVRGDFFFLGYTNGTWFSMGSKSVPAKDPERRGSAVCSFKYCEIYLRRTYKGKTSELLSLLPDVLSGKKPAPAYDPKVKPGVGPELKPAGAAD
ncbi:MAG: hypothetical protein VCD34_06185 [Planctomycetota bacterium]